MENSCSQSKKAPLILRALVLFFVFVVLAAAIFRFAYHHYPNVADWQGEVCALEGTEARVAFVYEGVVYHLSAELGTRGLKAKDYKAEEVLGEVTPEDDLTDQDAPYVLWSVEDEEDFILLMAEDGRKLVYYREGVENPATPEETEAET